MNYSRNFSESGGGISKPDNALCERERDRKEEKGNFHQKFCHTAFSTWDGTLLHFPLPRADDNLLLALLGRQGVHMGCVEGRADRAWPDKDYLGGSVDDTVAARVGYRSVYSQTRFFSVSNISACPCDYRLWRRRPTQ